jgi:bifunctional DNA-binding transcriptional regulator/antitoxin component of YhaV-PrlF toxin-antitoxin module
MPQLVKGGKYVFGWSRVSESGRIVIPQDAYAEYGYRDGEAVILMSGSRTSGGFSLIRESKFRESPVSIRFRGITAARMSEFRDAKSMKVGSRYVCRTRIRGRGITLPHETLLDFGTAEGSMLLVGRGSGLGPGFIARGPIVEEAKKHDELKICDNVQ